MANIRLNKINKKIFILSIMTFLNWAPPSEGATASGILMGEREITVKAKSPGELISVQLDEGSSVKAGEVIAILDDRQQKIERNLAQAEFTEAQTDFEKTKELKKYVSEEEVGTKKLNWVKKKSAFDLKDLAFSNTRIISPIDGIVTKRYFQKGETLSSGDKAFDVVQVENLNLEIHVPSKDAQRFKLGDELPFKTDLHKGQEFHAKISYISPVIDASSGTVRVKLKLKNRLLQDNTYELKPGTIANVEYQPFQAGVNP